MVSITVTPVNDTPLLAPVPDRSSAQGEAVSIALSASDVEDALEDLTFSLVSGPAGASVSEDGQFTWIATGSGAQEVTVRVTDSDGGFAVASFTITVTVEGNLAPQLGEIADQTIDEGATLSFALTATDEDDEPGSLTFSLVSGPAGATVSADGTFSWLATDAAAQHDVTVRVTDPDGAFDEATFRITVNLAAENTAPTLAEVPDQAIATGQVLILTLDGADAQDEDAALTYSLVSGPAGAAVSASGLFSWQAGAAGGEEPVTVRVTDSGGLSAERSFRILVSAPVENQAPVLAPVADLAVLAGDAIDFQLVATDADDELGSLAFSLVSGPAGASVSEGGQFTWTAAGPATEEVTVRVTDPDGAFAERSFRIVVSVSVENLPPVLDAVAAFTVAEGTTVSLQLAAGDPDGPLSALQWTLVSAPAGASLSDSGLLTWLAADGDLDGQFTVRVADAFGGFDEESFAVQVTDVAPTLGLAGAGETVAGSSYTVALSVADPGADTPVEWVIDWGDGTTPTTLAGTATGAAHTFASEGQFTVTARLRNEDGTFLAAPLGVAVARRPLLQVTGAAIADGAINVSFNRSFDPAIASIQAVTLTGALTGPVTGRLAFDGTGTGIVITRVDGLPLQYDLYELVLADSGFVSLLGSVLDGDANGIAGANYRTTLLYAGAAAGSAALPDFMYGPGEHVDVPREADQGLRVDFASNGGVKTMTFTVAFDPALLRLDGVLRGADLPAGAQLTWAVTPAAGGKSLLRVTIVSDTAIAAGSRHLVSLDATVPTSAPYGSSEILITAVERINNAVPAATQTDEALQLVGFFGDSDGDGDLDIRDLWETTLVTIGLRDDFPAWQGIDPAFVTDLLDHRKFANPFLPILENRLAEGQPPHGSVSAPAAAFPAIEYGLPAAVQRWGGSNWAMPGAEFGLEEAVAMWAGSIWSTETPPAPEQTAGEGRPVEDGAAVALPSAMQSEAQPVAEARIEMDGVPGALASAAAPAASVFAGLADAAKDTLDDGLLLVTLPAIRLDPGKSGRRKRRRKEIAA
jgi:hypothetical protein